MKSIDPDDYQNVSRPVAAMPKRFAAGHRIPVHSHVRAQLLLASRGAIEVTADENIWVVPHGRAVWIPAAIEHSVYIISTTTIDSLYIEASVDTGLNPQCQVLSISPLLQALISAAMDVPIEYELGSRDELLMQLIVAELESTSFVPLYAPMPKDRRLRAICHAIADDPSRAETLSEWGLIVGASARTLANRFQAETGLSFGRWRQQARLVEAVRRLASHQSVGTVAHDMGYRSESAFIVMFRRALGTTPARYFG